MNKVYTRIDWENYPSINTPINESNLNKMDAALDEVDNRVISLDTSKATKTEVATLVADVRFDESTGVITVTKKNGSTITIDTKMEKIAVNFTYDSATQQIILTLIDGTKQYIDLSALVTQYEFLDSDTIGFQVQPNGKIKAVVIDGSITENKLQPNYLADVTVQAQNALSSANSAASSADAAAYNAKLSQSYAVGGSSIRDGEDTDNAKYYKEQTAESENNASQSATQASNSANAAAASEANASTSASNAAASAESAASSANAAMNSANAATDSEERALDSANEAALSAESASVSATNAKASEVNAKSSEKAAKISETNAKTSETNAKNSEKNASTSADTASAKATEAGNSANAAATSATNALSSATTATNKATAADNSATDASNSASTATAQANSASSSATSASQSASSASQYATTAQNYAVGSTNSAKYYYEQAKAISESFSGALSPMGTVTFTNLPSVSSATEGDMYNVADQFTTTSDFKEGSGLTIPAGSNVYKTSDGKWDVLAGSPVTGVKGNAESGYRKGNVNITPDNIGLGNVPNVATNDQTPTFTKASTRANIASGEKLSVIFGKIMKFFADLKTVAFSGSYNDLSNKPTIPAAVAVKGNAEYSYRTGNVNLTPANLGALATNGDSKSNTVTFTSNDVADGSATSWTSVTALASGITHATFFQRVSQMFKNVRYLYKMLGTTDISAIGDGTVSGAISSLNSNLSNNFILSLNGQGDQYHITLMYIGSNGKLNIHCKNGDVYIADVSKLL